MTRAMALLAGVLLAVPLLDGCGAARRAVQNREPIGDGDERMLGARLSAAVQAERKSASDPTVIGYVSSLGDRMARLSDRPGIPYVFAVYADTAAQAFSLPGGYVYVSTGLLARLGSRAELAGVLGHEIAHIAARDGVSRIVETVAREGVERILLTPRDGPPDPETKRALDAVLAGYPRDVERAADLAASLLATRVGLNAEGLVRAMDKVNAGSAAPGMFWESQPSKSDPIVKRIDGVRAEQKRMGLDAGLPYDPDSYAPIRARVTGSR
ncbi:MAG: M48 family metalloprotease [Hyphomicrobiales bacterium]